MLFKNPEVEDSKNKFLHYLPEVLLIVALRTVYPKMPHMGSLSQIPTFDQQFDHNL